MSERQDQEKARLVAPIVISAIGTVTPLTVAWYDLTDPGAFALLPVMVLCLTLAPAAVVVSIVRIFKTTSLGWNIWFSLLAIANTLLFCYIAFSLFGRPSN